MLHHFLLVFLVVGCCLFIGCNEVLLREVWLRKQYETISLSAFEQRIFMVFGLSGLMLASLSLLLLHRLAQDMLHMIFPSHLVRLWQGVRQGLSSLTSPVDGKEE